MCKNNPRHLRAAIYGLVAMLASIAVCAEDLQQAASALERQRSALMLQLSQQKSELVRLSSEGLQWIGPKTDSVNNDITAHNARIAKARSDDVTRQALRNSYFQLGNSTCLNADWATAGGCDHPADQNDPRLDQMHRMADQIQVADRAANAEDRAIEDEGSQIKARSKDVSNNIDRIMQMVEPIKATIVDLQRQVARNESDLEEVQAKIDASAVSVPPVSVATPSTPGILVANAAVIQTKRVQVKSYIARMGPAAASRTVPPAAATNAALGFADLVGGRVDALAFMYKTDDNFSENPASGDPAVADFRIWSEVKINGSCQADGTLGNFSAVGLRTSFGKEGPLNATGETMVPVKTAQRLDAYHTGTFEYVVRARPNAMSALLFNAIKPRSAVWIWHRVSGTARCIGRQLVIDTALLGSHFPSHRLWIDGVLTRELKQGPFENLWQADSTDNTLVN